MVHTSTIIRLVTQSIRSLPNAQNSPTTKLSQHGPLDPSNDLQNKHDDFDIVSDRLTHDAPPAPADRTAAIDCVLVYLRALFHCCLEGTMTKRLDELEACGHEAVTGAWQDFRGDTSRLEEWRTRKVDGTGFLDLFDRLVMQPLGATSLLALCRLLYTKSEDGTQYVPTDDVSGNMLEMDCSDQNHGTVQSFIASEIGEAMRNGTMTLKVCAEPEMINIVYKPNADLTLPFLKVTEFTVPVLRRREDGTNDIDSTARYTLKMAFHLASPPEAKVLQSFATFPGFQTFGLFLDRYSPAGYLLTYQRSFNDVPQAPYHDYYLKSKRETVPSGETAKKMLNSLKDDIREGMGSLRSGAGTKDGSEDQTAFSDPFLDS